jgi:hypothetical protein
MSRLVLLLLALGWSASWACAEKAREFSQEQRAFLETKSRPVLIEHFLACPSDDDKQKRGLSLVSRAGLLRGGESGSAIVPGKPGASLLLKALRYESYGREHNPFGFTKLMAGGGIRGGIVHGATDEYGYRAIDGKVHVHDLHATMLRQLGLNHERQTYRYAGRDFRLTDVQDTVVKEILA